MKNKKQNEHAEEVIRVLKEIINLDIAYNLNLERKKERNSKK